MSNTSQSGSKRGTKKFVAYVTDPKTGKRRYARDYGKRAFVIYVQYITCH